MAKTMVKSASLPPVMKVFSPRMTQSEPSLRALVLIAVASEPAPGSVIAKHEIRWPSMVGSRYSCRCDSLAWNRMLSAAPPNRNGMKDLPSSTSIRAASTADNPIPPYSSGV